MTEATKPLKARATNPDDSGDDTEAMDDDMYPDELDEGAKSLEDDHYPDDDDYEEIPEDEA